MQSLTPVTTGLELNPTIHTLTSRRSATSDPHAAQEVAKQFESVFASILLKESRATLDPASLFEGDRNDVYGGLFDMFLGQHIAESGGLGIAEMVASYIQTMESQKSP